MATVHVVLANVAARADTGATLPVPDSTPIAVDTMTSSGTSAQANITASGPNEGEVWCVTAVGGPVYVRTGVNPTAVTDQGWLVADGQTLSLAVTVASEKLAIKDV